MLKPLFLFLSVSASAQVSYFNEGFLRQGNAALDRSYLGINGTNATPTFVKVTPPLTATTNAGPLVTISYNENILSNVLYADIVGATNGFSNPTNNDNLISNILFLDIVGSTNGALALATNNDLLIGLRGSNNVMVASNTLWLSSSNLVYQGTNALPTGAFTSSNTMWLNSSNLAYQVTNGLTTGAFTSSNTTWVNSSNLAYQVTNGLTTGAFTTSNTAWLNSSNLVYQGTNGISSGFITGKLGFSPATNGILFTTLHGGNLGNPATLGTAGRFIPLADTGVNQAGETLASSPWGPRAVTLTNWFLKWTLSVGANTNVWCTLYINGVSNNFNINFIGAATAPFVVSNTTSSVTLPANGTASFKITANNGTPSTATLQSYIEAVQ